MGLGVGRAESVRGGEGDSGASGPVVHVSDVGGEDDEGGAWDGRGRGHDVDGGRGGFNE